MIDPLTLGIAVAVIVVMLALAVRSRTRPRDIGGGSQGGPVVRGRGPRNVTASGPSAPLSHGGPIIGELRPPPLPAGGPVQPGIGLEAFPPAMQRELVRLLQRGELFKAIRLAHRYTGFDKKRIRALLESLSAYRR